MHILTDQQLKRLLHDEYSRGIDRGYELGFTMGKIEESNRGLIHIKHTPSKLRREVDDIARGKGVS